MPRVDFERTERYFHGLNAEKFQPILATNSNGLTNSRQCSVCVSPRDAESNSCRTTWTPDATQVYYADTDTNPVSPLTLDYTGLSIGISPRDLYNGWGVSDSGWTYSSITQPDFFQLDTLTSYQIPMPDRLYLIFSGQSTPSCKEEVIYHEYTFSEDYTFGDTNPTAPAAILEGTAVEEDEDNFQDILIGISGSETITIGASWKFENGRYSVNVVVNQLVDITHHTINGAYFDTGGSPRIEFSVSSGFPPGLSNGRLEADFLGILQSSLGSEAHFQAESPVTDTLSVILNSWTGSYTTPGGAQSTSLAADATGGVVATGVTRGGPA